MSLDRERHNDHALCPEVIAMKAKETPDKFDAGLWYAVRRNAANDDAKQSPSLPGLPPKPTVQQTLAA